MTWDDCPLSGSAETNKAFTCDTNLGFSALYCAFSVTQPIDQIVGLEIVVDVQHSLGALPDYWQLGPAPQCRYDMLSASVNFSDANACASPGFTGAVMQDYRVGEPRAGFRRRRGSRRWCSCRAPRRAASPTTPSTTPCGWCSRTTAP